MKFFLRINTFGEIKGAVWSENYKTPLKKVAVFNEKKGTRKPLL